MFKLLVAVPSCCFIAFVFSFLVFGFSSLKGGVQEGGLHCSTITRRNDVSIGKGKCGLWRAFFAVIVPP